MVKKDNTGGVSVRPDSFRDSIESLIYNGDRPPKLSSSELDRLDFNNSRGIAAVKEALLDSPFQYVNYRELSRYATHIACGRLESDSSVLSLMDVVREYRANKKKFNQRTRKFYDDYLKAASFGYKPFVPQNNVHMWMWNSDEQDSVRSNLSMAGLPRHIFYAYVADALREIPALEVIAADLSDEYDMAMRFVGCFQAVVAHIIEELKRV